LKVVRDVRGNSVELDDQTGTPPYEIEFIALDEEPGLRSFDAVPLEDAHEPIYPPP